MSDRPPRDPARHRSRSTSARGIERSAQQPQVQGARTDATDRARAAAAAPCAAAPATRDLPPPRTPASGARPTDVTPHRAPGPPPAEDRAPSASHAQLVSARTEDSHPPAPTPPAQQAIATRQSRSPKSDLESDLVIVARLIKANLITGDLAKAMAMHLNDRQRLLNEEGAQTPTEEEMEEARQFAALTPVPAAPPGTLKRQRTETDLQADTKVARVGDAAPQPQRDPRLLRRPTAAPRVVSMDTTEAGPSQTTPAPPPAQPPAQQRPATPKDDARPSTSFADAARTPRSAQATAPPAAPSQGPAPPAPDPAAATTAAASKPKAPRYPPLVVETLPNWAYHLRILKQKLGRTPNARPFGKGIKFIPTEDHEYRLIQRYLTELEKMEKISWFSYSLPAERSLKVAIRGVPVDTDPEEIAADLRAQGFEPEVVRPIKARKGRPGCIFFAILKRTANTTPDIYQVSELLCMPGVQIEAWRGKKGPAQCHRCQQFRHSSHNCHRRQACVRCGEEHSAHDCPRPREEPATCANCGGPHPANNLSCPVFRREARNKRAGTVAITTAEPKTKKATITDPIGSASQTTAGGSNIRTPANEPTHRGPQEQFPRKRKPKRKKRASKTAPPPAQPQPETETETATRTTKKTEPKGTQASETVPQQQQASPILHTAIEILKEILEALAEGKEIVPIVLRGIQNLLSSK